VSWVWEHRHAVDLQTTDGIPVQVVYPGRRGGSWGPDFRGALIALGTNLLRGDVEVHLRPQDWALHRHEHDPAYGRTILHVVFQDTPGVVCSRADGLALPAVALGDSLAAPLPLLLRRWEAAPGARPLWRPCRTPDEAASLLDAAGLERFAARVDRFEADFSVVSRAQALWAGLCDALGYTTNRAPFRALADRLPIEELAALARDPRPNALAAALFGEAGLLPHQRGRLALDSYSAELEQLWMMLRRRGPLRPLGWRWVGVRPTNQPVRRVAAAVGLIRSGSTGGLDEAILTILRAPGPRAARQLAALSRETRDPYWDGHRDFGDPMRRPAALIGAPRAREITVNVLLPWAAAVGRVSGDAALEARAVAVYRSHPRLASNSVTRHMALQLLGAYAREVLQGACRQQGLHHVFGHWCDDRECASCIAGPGFHPAARASDLGTAAGSAR
jgi:hypothetical protein